MSRSKIWLARLVGAFLLSFCSFSYSNAQTPTVTNPTFGDDTYVQVPLQFGFPFYGRTFTNSWMHSNGVVSFLDPAVPIEGVGYNPGAWAYCCGDRPTITKPQFSYMIAPLWTDLYPDGQSTFRTEGTTQYQRYFWNNLGEISNVSNRNTFSLEIRPSGFIGTNYSQINMNQTAWIGTVGNPATQEINEIFYGSPGHNYTGLTGWSSENTPTGNLCLVDPLSSPTCPGYTDAMCTSNPLYSATCSGYQQAYLTQQCSINALHHPSCPGYALAYLNYQCSIDPLYSTACEGYEQAYFNQQCSNDALYDRTCPGYSQAYALKFVVSSPVSVNVQPVATSIKSETKVALVEDSNVNEVLTTTATSTSPADSATTFVPLVSQPSTTTTTASAEEPKTEVKTESTNSTTTSTSSSDSSAEKPKTARQQLQERRQAAARAKAVEEGKQMADTVGKATSMEQQIAVQNVLIQAMGYTPGFEAYSQVMIVQTPFYKPEQVYKNQNNVDNRAVGARLFGGTDRVHSEMVDAQYQLGK